MTETIGSTVNTHLWRSAADKVGKVLNIQMVEDENYKFTQSKALAKLLGVPYPNPDYVEFMLATDEQQAKLAMINGVHGETIIKAMAAKHDT